MSRNTHYNKVSSSYPIWLPSNGTKKDSIKNLNQREVIQRVGKGEQSFLQATGHINLKHIAMMFHPDIPYDYTELWSTQG